LWDVLVGRCVFGAEFGAILTMAKKPIDRRRYPQDRRSREIAPGIPDGDYVYVVSTNGVIWVAPDGCHMHPKVLGNAQPADYAGEVRVTDGKIAELTNNSGTFQFGKAKGLRNVAQKLRDLGFVVEYGAVRFFPSDGSPPRVIE
jgi:hypothetical protein